MPDAPSDSQSAAARTAGAVRAARTAGRALLQPWRDLGSLWWGLVHLVTGLVTGVVTFAAVVSLLAVTVALLITFPLALPFAWLLFVVARAGSRVERSRFAALLGVEMEDPVPRLEGPTWWARLKERARSRPRWREIVYALVRLPLGILGMLLAQFVWCGSVALIGLPLYVSRLPGDTAKFWLFEISQGLTAYLASMAGILGLVLVAPWLTKALLWLDVAISRWFLDRRRANVLGERVAHLEATRSAVVDSAETERRRIERDLHDGAQQRLVAMAVNLGAAREKLSEDPETGQQLVAEAHEDAKAALKELRDLVRGIHPVILEDRGLDPALSSVVARMPVPVHLNVDVAERPSAVVESTAYFVVTEALTNVARHAQASEAHVNIVRAANRMVVEVRDDGVGGADPARGTGLAGLRSRVEALDGRLDLLSPSGGPTTLLVEVPC